MIISNAEKTILRKNCMDLLNENLDTLKHKMTVLREEYFGNTVHLCSLVNAKNGKCSEDCRYCAQSAHYNTEIADYPLMSFEEMYQKALIDESLGIENFSIVTSGPALKDKEIDLICRAVEKISTKTVLKPCASLGRLTLKQFDKLKAAGLKRYHHNLETSKRFYPEICTTHSWEERVETVLLAKEVGFKICSGGLFGLGENWEDRIDLAITLKELDVDSIPINFLTAIPGTPLAGQKKLTVDEALKIVALYRYILPDKTVRICGGRPTVLGNRQDEIYNAGANAVMTGDYLTSYGVSPEQDIRTIYKQGLKPVCD
jgi:biotin synthase